MAPTTILPLAYPPTMFHHGAAPPPAAAAIAHSQHMQAAPSAQLIYAPAALDANGQPGTQYFTIPMGYPYTYHG